MDSSVKITRKRGITVVPTFMILLIETLQVVTKICIYKKITNNIILVLKYC